MCDANHRLRTLATGCKVLQKPFFGLGIKCGSSFVKNKYPTRTKQGPGYRDALGLTFAEASAHLRADGIQSVGELPDELGGSHIQHFHQGFVGGIGICQMQEGVGGS